MCSATAYPAIEASSTPAWSPVDLLDATPELDLRTGGGGRQGRSAAIATVTADWGVPFWR